MRSDLRYAASMNTIETSLLDHTGGETVRLSNEQVSMKPEAHLQVGRLLKLVSPKVLTTKLVTAPPKKNGANGGGQSAEQFYVREFDKPNK